MQIINKRSGKIKIRVFALMLLALSTSMCISAYKSMSRSFSGIVVNKSTAAGITSDRYWLSLSPMAEIEPLSPGDRITMAIQGKLQGHLIGVSEMVHEQASLMENVSKERFSPFIKVGTEKFIDLGLNWLILGIFGILGSLFMYKQTLVPLPNSPETEEIELPEL